MMNKTQSLENFVFLVGLHVYYSMIHGPYNIEVAEVCKLFHTSCVVHN